MKQKDFSKMTKAQQQTNKPTNQKRIYQKRFTFVVSFVALGVWVVIN
jgi:hypothetical protein